jgi:hypothetical protein
MNENKNFFRASAEDFKKISDSPVAYWMGDGVRDRCRSQPFDSLNA